MQTPVGFRILKRKEEDGFYLLYRKKIWSNKMIKNVKIMRDYQLNLIKALD